MSVCLYMYVRVGSHVGDDFVLNTKSVSNRSLMVVVIFCTEKRATTIPSVMSSGNCCCDDKISIFMYVCVYIYAYAVHLKWGRGRPYIL